MRSQKRRRDKQQQKLQQADGEQQPGVHQIEEDVEQDQQGDAEEEVEESAEELPPQVEQVQSHEGHDHDSLRRENILRQIERFATYMVSATENVNAASTKRSWFGMLEKFLHFVQDILWKEAETSKTAHRLVTLEDLLRTEFNAPFRRLCAQQGKSQLSTFQRLLNKLLLKVESEKTLVNRETVSQLQKANSKRQRLSTRLRRQVADAHRTRTQTAAAPATFLEVRGAGLAHGHAILHEYKRRLLDVAAGARRRLPYQERAIAAGLLAAMLSLKKPSRAINLSRLKLADAAAMEQAHTSGNGVFTMTQGKLSCRDEFTFLVIDEDIVVFLRYHVDVVRPALIASSIESAKGVKSLGRGKAKVVEADLDHAEKLYTLLPDEYFLAARKAGVPAAAHGGRGRNKLKDIFTYMAPERGWQTRQLTWEKLKFYLIKERMDQLFLGPAGDSNPSLGSLVRAVLKSAGVNEGQGETLLGLRKLLAKDTRQQFDNDEIPRSEYLSIVKSLEHTELVSQRSYEGRRSQIELGHNFVSSLGLVVRKEEPDGDDDNDGDDADDADDGDDGDDGDDVDDGDDGDDACDDVSDHVVAKRRRIAAVDYVKGKRCRIGWSDKEKEALRAGYKEFGSEWASILASARFGQCFHEKRTPTDLKDLWRNIEGSRKKQRKNSSIGRGLFRWVKGFFSKA